MEAGRTFEVPSSADSTPGFLQSHRQYQAAASHDLASGFTRGGVLASRGEYTLRSPGFVPVANVQLLIGASAVLSSLVIASSVVVHL